MFLEAEPYLGHSRACMTGFPKWVWLVGGRFGQNSQKLHEMTKLAFLGQNSRGGGGGYGGKPIFQVVRGIPPVPPSPLGETLYDDGPVTIDVWLGSKYASYKTETFKMKFRLAKLRLLTTRSVCFCYLKRRKNFRKTIT